MAVYCSGPVDFAESSFHLREFETHIPSFSIREGGDCPFVDRTSGGEAEVRGRFGDVEVEHFEFVFVGDCASCSFVDSHRMSGEATLFFQVTIHEVQSFSELGRAAFYRLLEEIP